MDLLKAPVKPLFFRYLSSAFGSALISSIYGVVDLAVVGQYHGPNGTAALAVVAPVWNVIYSLGLLTGIGGSVLFSTARGQQGNAQEERQCFTASVIFSVILALLAWGLLLFAEAPILRFFGADEALLPLAQQYLQPIRVVLPLYLFNQMLAAFLRNDGAPGLATIGVLAGGLFNVFGDIFFVFTLHMGIGGAGLATAIGAGISFCVLMLHFASKKNTLHLDKPAQLMHRCGKIAATGFSSFFVDVAMGILTILFNRQIMRYQGADALAIYGCIINVSTFVQCCAYSVGQAAQPIISTNFGARHALRIRQTLRYALLTTAALTLFWTLLSLLFPTLYIRIFMTPTDSILALAPSMIRRYALSFLLLPFNIFSTYYFQAILKPQTAFMVSVTRGLVVSGILIFVLPMVFGADSLWFAMPMTEVITTVYAFLAMRRCTLALPDADCPARQL